MNKNYKIESLVNMAVMAEHSLELAESKVKGCKDRLVELNSLIKQKQQETGMADSQIKEIKDKAIEDLNNPGVCPI